MCPMKSDPVATNPEFYLVGFENERVRVLEYRDRPGDRTEPHDHPDSVMVTLNSFRRRLAVGDTHRDVELPSGLTAWLPAQRHCGENIGDSETHVIFVELKEPGASVPSGIGPVVG
jgi:beta-alanine degradation protein BauB